LSTDAKQGRKAVEAVWRIESARIVGALARLTGDFPLAEDLAQEALAEALVKWPIEGVPRNPTGWLLTVGRRRAIDTYRRRAALDDRYAAFARELDEGGGWSGARPAGGNDDNDLLWDPDHIDDDVLALVFTACHQVLSREAQVALTLRVVGGLSSDEIARAFLIPTATVQARITRAKKTLGAARVAFGVPPQDEWRERLGPVLSVVYLVFTEGSTATSGMEWIRADLAYEAIRLARVLVRLMPEESEVHGLLALMELTASRFRARTDAEGEPVLLEDQDRSRWDRPAIARGRAALATAERTGRGLGPYGVQAAIAECHAVASGVDETDWDRVVLLYDVLNRLAPSPIVELNRAVAISMARGPAAGLAEVDALRDDDLLSGSHLLPSVRGELLTRLDRPAEAESELRVAIERCQNERERRLLEGKLANLRAASAPDEATS
jgi:RNA polymerase sigma factor (sigma-70 family)